MMKLKLIFRGGARAWVAGVLLSFTGQGGAATLHDVYVTAYSTADGGRTSEIIRYSWDSSASSAIRQASDVIPTGYRLSNASNRSQTTLSGDGKSLSLVMFHTNTAVTTNYFTSFNLGTRSFDTTTAVTNSNYNQIWSPDGQRFYAVGTTGTNASPGYAEYGASSVTPLRTNQLTMNSVGFHNNRIYASRTAATGILQFQNAGLSTASGTWTTLSGNGWDTSTNYGQFAFLGEQHLFVTDATNEMIRVFYNESAGTPTAGWNLLTMISTTSTGTSALSLIDQGDGGARLFFSGTDKFGTVTWNGTGFEGLAILGTAPDGYTFQGMVAVPEPGGLLLCGVGGALLVSLRRRKTVELREGMVA